MKFSWTSIQHMRLSELNADPSNFQIKFEDAGQRNAVFQKLEKKLVKEQKNKLEDLRQIHF
ncbi:MAG: pyrrolysine--tRNA(Pyl) ligase large subunit, partial [Deltaproteobacteria bacterium]